MLLHQHSDDVSVAFSFLQLALFERHANQPGLSRAHTSWAISLSPAHLTCGKMGDAAALVHEWRTACARDEFPKSPAVLKAFLYDRCEAWTELLGLHVGVVYIEHCLNKDFTDEVVRAVEQRDVVQTLDNIYREFHASATTGDPRSGYYKWFEVNKARLAALENPGPVQPGAKVQLSGLTQSAMLNAAIGKVVSEPDDTNNRFPVRLLSPPSAVARHPGGVRVREANIERAPDGVVAAAILFGMSIIPAWSCRPTVGAPCPWGVASRQPHIPTWQPCAVANMLGLPLAYCQLAPQARQSAESLGVFVTVDPVTGFAPDEIQACGLGPIMVARTDGGDLSMDEVWQLHDYNCHLMDVWENFDTSSSGDAARRRALTAAAFKHFVEQRA